MKCLGESIFRKQLHLKFMRSLINVCLCTFLKILRFEAEISGVATGSSSNQPSNLFVPSQLRPMIGRPIIGANTYNTIQQKLHQQAPVPAKTMPVAPPVTIPPPPMPPTFIQSFMPQTNELPEKSYNSEPTPVVLSSAPKLYTNRLSVNPIETPAAPHVNYFSYHH